MFKNRITETLTTKSDLYNRGKVVTFSGFFSLMTITYLKGANVYLFIAVLERKDINVCVGTIYLCQKDYLWFRFIGGHDFKLMTPELLINTWT